MALSTGSGLIHLIHSSSGPRVLNPNGTSIGSSVFVGLAVASRCDPTTANNLCPCPQKNYLKIATVQMSVSSLVECTQNTCTRAFKGSLSGTTRVSRYQKGKTNLDFTEARDSEWQWHQLGRMQVCTSLQTDNHARTPPLSSYRSDALPAAQPTASKH